MKAQKPPKRCKAGRATRRAEPPLLYHVLAAELLALRLRGAHSVLLALPRKRADFYFIPLFQPMFLVSEVTVPMPNLTNDHRILLTSVN